MYVFETGMCDKMGHKIQDVTENCRARKGCADPKTAHLKLRWQDTEVMESNISALLPMSGLTQSSLWTFDLTDVLSGEQYVTASCLIPLITHLCKEALNDDAAHTSQTLKCDIQRKIREYMTNKYVWGWTENNYWHCCTLRALNYSSEEESTAVHQKIIQEGVIVAKRIEEETPNTPQNEDFQSVTADMAPIKKKKKTGWYSN